MRKILLILFLPLSLLAQIPQTNLIGQWTGGINADSTIYVGTDTLKLYNVDFDISLGYLPLKTRAEIKRIGGSSVDTALWINLTPITVLSECIDYKYQSFIKISNATYLANGRENLPHRITEIAIYSAKKTGADSVSLNSYFSIPILNRGSKYVDFWNGVDATGTGTFDNPYKTITKAVTVSTDTIYCKSGVYNEGTGITISKTFHIIGIGRCQMANTGTSYQTRAGLGGATAYMKNIFCIKNNYAYFLQIYGNLAKATLEKCYIRAIRANGSYPIYFDIIATRTTNFKLDKCYIKSTLLGTGVIGYNRFSNTDTIVSTLFHSHIIFDGPSAYCAYNKFINTTENTGTSIISYAATRFFYNDFYCKKQMYSNLALTTSAKTKTELYRNNIYILDTILADLAWFRANSDSSISVYNSNNFYTEAVSYTGSCAFVNIVNGLGRYIGNTCNVVNDRASALNKFYCLFISSTGNLDTCINNSIYGYHSGGIFIGGEAAVNNVADNAIITGNYVTSSYGTDSIGSNVHGILVTSSVNCFIAYNYVQYCGAGIVYKTSGESSPNNGMCYNVVYRCGDMMYCRGCNGVNIFNNTLINDNYDYPYGVKSAIIVDVNSAASPFDTSRNVKVFNNIIYISGIDAGYAAYRIDSFAIKYGTTISHDMWISGSDSMIRKGLAGGYLTQPQAESLGIVSSTLNQDALLSNFVPANQNAIGTGKLYSAFPLGLNKNATFPNPTIENQFTLWDIGAFVINDVRLVKYGTECAKYSNVLKSIK